MEWTDQGVVLSRRRHGESSAVAALFTREHGVHAGLARGATRSQSAVYQTGNLVAARWRGRLPEHLGSYSCELVEGLAGAAFDDAARLDAMVATAALIEAGLAERQAHARLFDATLDLLRRIAAPSGGFADWGAEYVRWEVGYLAELGFGLDLASCAATGVSHGLAYVSPRTGRAVSAAAGAPYAGRLLVLPRFLHDAKAAATMADLGDGLDLTGRFVERHVLGPAGKRMPAARLRLAERARRPGASSGMRREP